MSSTFPVAFLEPSLNKFNAHSVMGSGFAQRSLEAQESVARLEQCVPNLEAQLQEVDRFVGEGKDHAGKELTCSLDFCRLLLRSYTNNKFI